MAVHRSPSGLKDSTYFTYPCPPSAWIPYLELARLHKPSAILIAFFPYQFGILLAASTADPVVPPARILTIELLALVHSTIVRGIGCTWNDFLDRDIDGKISRTRLRPLACGAVPAQGALIFLGFQIVVELGVLQRFSTQHHYYIIPWFILIGVYPLAKRVVNYSQILLGLIAAGGIVLAFPALGVKIQSSNWTAMGSLLIFNIGWVIGLDFVYAHQDIEDDKKIGIGSMAVRHRKHAKAILAGLVVMQILCLWNVGKAMETGIMYYVSVFGSVLSVFSHMFTLDLQSPQRCAWWFKHGTWVTGAGVTLGLLSEYVQRLKTV